MRIIATTQTAINKIKARSKQLRQAYSSLGAARDAAAVEAGYDNFHHATQCLKKSTVPDDAPLSKDGKRLVEALEAMQAAQNSQSEIEFMRRRFAAVRIWREMAQNERQAELYRVQREIAGNLSLCKAYFEVFVIAIELPPELNRYPYTGALVLNFNVLNWQHTAPLVYVEEVSRRALLKLLRSQLTVPGDLRLSRYAVVTQSSHPDVPSDTAVFHAAQTAFHVAPPPALEPIEIDPKGDQRAVLTMIATFSAGDDTALDWDHFGELLEDVGSITNPGYSATFVRPFSGHSEGWSWGCGELGLYLGNDSWKAISELDLPSPPDICNHNRKRPDPFVLKFQLDREALSATGTRTFNVSIAAKHLSASPNAFREIGRTKAPAFCAGWCDHYLRTIRAAGMLDRVELVL